jgi:hypothetical protein
MYKSTLNNTAEERRCNLQNNESLKSHNSGRYRNIAAIGNYSTKSVKRMGKI